MTRSVGLRLPDAQYDWLVERTVDFDGDLSEAIRDAINAARMFYGVVTAADPHAALQAILDESRRNEAREAFRNEFGHYPEEASDAG